ncbi:hypothetical protein SynBIOSU31_01349 [Synechococcus sp. BIOS-U3-1]|uniref:hypothetical protein n=1 Tax=Synechococcus sp. BIOS-U3-1 TaxID=1400865 RepID=UPI0016454522|nr:hypothetical protein [Synechococcus sp. BIOS-U3-1]QNI58224.1 hypothetical protein SynBIOSU31_01349 [Synechococcus sp. BIOS-U3-1]
MNIAQIEDALLAPCMDAVIAVTERYQFLEIHRGARVFTAYREIDHVMYLGFHEDLTEPSLRQLKERGFQMLGIREGTRREHRLLLLTLKEIGYSHSYGEGYYEASRSLARHLRNLGWPLGALTQLLNSPRISMDDPNN